MFSLMLATIFLLVIFFPYPTLQAILNAVKPTFDEVSQVEVALESSEDDVLLSFLNDFVNYSGAKDWAAPSTFAPSKPLRSPPSLPAPRTPPAEHRGISGGLLSRVLSPLHSSTRIPIYTFAPRAFPPPTAYHIAIDVRSRQVANIAVHRTTPTHITAIVSTPTLTAPCDAQPSELAIAVRDISGERIPAGANVELSSSPAALTAVEQLTAALTLPPTVPSVSATAAVAVVPSTTPLPLLPATPSPKTSTSSTSSCLPIVRKTTSRPIAPAPSASTRVVDKAPRASTSSTPAWASSSSLSSKVVDVTKLPASSLPRPIVGKHPSTSRISALSSTRVIRNIPRASRPSDSTPSKLPLPATNSPSAPSKPIPSAIPLPPQTPPSPSEPSARGSGKTRRPTPALVPAPTSAPVEHSIPPAIGPPTPILAKRPDTDVFFPFDAEYDRIFRVLLAAMHRDDKVEIAKLQHDATKRTIELFCLELEKEAAEEAKAKRARRAARKAAREAKEDGRLAEAASLLASVLTPNSGPAPSNGTAVNDHAILPSSPRPSPPSTSTAPALPTPAVVVAPLVFALVTLPDTPFTFTASSSSLPPIVGEPASRPIASAPKSRAKSLKPTTCTPLSLPLPPAMDYVPAEER